MKGIILAGGKGTRLYPLTKVISKQLLPVHDKPMIYYPLSTLMEADIREILIISDGKDMPAYKELLKDGGNWGIHIEYKVQPSPGGIPQAFILAEEFVGNSPSALILGDNILYGEDLIDKIVGAMRENKGATCFAYPVDDPERYGIITIDGQGMPLSIEEKPQNLQSGLAVPGIYIVDSRAVTFAKRLVPSKRDELEITDLLQEYLKRRELRAVVLDREVKWIDAGIPESLTEATEFIWKMEKKLGSKLGCPEEAAYQKKWISREHLARIIKEDEPSYGEYLLEMLEKSREA